MDMIFTLWIVVMVSWVYMQVQNYNKNTGNMCNFFVRGDQKNHKENNT